MPTPTLRPMTTADVSPAAEMILRNGWGVRREWFELATTEPACIPLVADAEGVVVGTGVGTVNGTVGWVGTIFVEPAWRGQGLGRSITEAIVDRLESAGCLTLVLVATADGRRLYERMGFEVQTRYRILEAPGLPPGSGEDGVDGGVRGFSSKDLAGMIEIDRTATGEDRSHILRRLASPATTKVLVGGDGPMRGFVIRAPWGGGATVAAQVGDAMALIDARRRASGPDGRIRVGVLDENGAGLAALAGAGFTDQWSAPRMIRGASMTWHPEWIWGQFNHAMG